MQLVPPLGREQTGDVSGVRGGSHLGPCPNLLPWCFLPHLVSVERRLKGSGFHGSGPKGHVRQSEEGESPWLGRTRGGGSSELGASPQRKG